MLTRLLGQPYCFFHVQALRAAATAAQLDKEAALAEAAATHTAQLAAQEDDVAAAKLEAV